MAGQWWRAWVLDLPVLAPAAGMALLYLRAVGTGVRRRTAAFLTGVAVGLLALCGPPAGLSAELFTAHMVQHLLLTVVAAPLLAAGRPVRTIRRLLPPPVRHAIAVPARAWLRRRGRLWPPVVVATVVHVVTVWAWHVPVVYEAALTRSWLHLAEHATLLLTAVWLWSEVWATARRHPRVQALATLSLGGMIVQGGLLGALITFAGRPLYPTYTGAGGITALADQQLGGTVMWVVPGFAYAIVAVRRFVGWLAVVEAGARKRDPPLRARS